MSVCATQKFNKKAKTPRARGAKHKPHGSAPVKAPVNPRAKSDATTPQHAVATTPSLEKPARKTKKYRPRTKSAESDIIGALLQRVARGDKPAEALLFKELHTTLNNAIRHKIVNPDDREDIVQQAMIKVFQQAHRFDPAIACGYTWVARIANNKAVDHLRGQNRSPAKKMKYLEDTDGKDLAASFLQAGLVSDVERAEDRIQRLGLVKDLLMALGPEDQKILKSTTICGRTFKECARDLDKSLGTVKSSMTRIRQKLLKAFQLNEHDLSLL